MAPWEEQEILEYDAHDQLRPGPRRRPVRSFHRRVLRQQPAGCRYLFLEWGGLCLCHCCRELIHHIPVEIQQKNQKMIRTSSLAAVLLAVMFGTSAQAQIWS